MSESPDRNGIQRRARARRLRSDFLAVTASQVDGLTDILKGEPDADTLETLGLELGRLAMTADSLALAPLGTALLEAGGALVQQGGAAALSGVVEALAEAGYHATFPPIAVVASQEVRQRLISQAELCCEPLRFYDHVDQVASEVLATGRQGVVLPYDQVQRASGLRGVRLFPYGPADQPELPATVSQPEVHGFLLEPLRLREVLSSVRRATYAALAPAPRVVLLIDDDDLRAALADDLESRDIMVSASGDRDDLLRLLGQAVPDLVVLGPGTHGAPTASLIQIVRGTERHGETRVVALGPSSTLEVVLQAGAEALLPADLSPQEVARRIYLRLRWSPGRFRERDPVSGVLTRPAVLDAIDQELARARRTSMPLATAVLDLDETKAINERHGRAGGNAALRAVGQALEGRLRANDVVGRLGSDAFVVALPACSVEHARRRLHHIQRLLLSVASSDPRLRGLAFTAGVAGTERGLDSVLLRADRVLAQARGRGDVGVVEVE